MNAQPNSPEHTEETARRSETEHRGIVENIPATADQRTKLSSQPVQAEEALRRAEEELRDLIENMPAIAGVLLPDGSHPYLTTLGSSDPERRQKIQERMHAFGGSIFESNLPPELQEEIESEIERQKAAQRATAPGR